MGTSSKANDHAKWEQKADTLVHGIALALACLLSYYFSVDLLIHVDSLSHPDDLLGGMWAVIATVFVYRTSYAQSVTAAVSRASATLVSFALCFVYLVITPFHPWGMALLIGVGATVVTLLGRPDDTVTTGITTAVVMVVAALSPRDAWEQPILRVFDTGVGVAVGLVAQRMGLRAGQLSHRHTGRPTETRAQPPPSGGNRAWRVRPLHSRPHSSHVWRGDAPPRGINAAFRLGHSDAGSATP